MRMVLALLGACLLIGCPGAARAAEQGEQVFAREASLMAFLRIRNLASCDARIAKTLQNVYAGSTTTQPLRNALGAKLHNPTMNAVQAGNWIEAVLFSLPLEKDNDWVYIVHTDGEDPYIAALLDAGNIRREVREEGITRFRITEGENFRMFFTVFAGPDLMISGTNRTAVDKARKLYAFTPQQGLFSGYGNDFASGLHFNRYLLASPRAISDVSEMLRQDLVRDLAGGQAKQDNPLTLGLARALESSAEMVRELAVAEFTADLREDATELEGRLIVRYGGSVHFALSNLKNLGQVNRSEMPGLLPPGVMALSRGALWPEMYTQGLEGMARAVQASFSHQTPQEVLTDARKFMALLKEAGPVAYATGLADPAPGDRKRGPMLISVVRWQDAQKLGALWDHGLKMVSEGSLSELLAERGMKLSAETETISAGGWPVTRTTLNARSTYFTLPGGLAQAQHYLSGRQGNYLAIAFPPAPVAPDEYSDLEPHLLELLAATLSRLPGAAGGAVAAQAGKENTEAQPRLPDYRADEICAFAANPLRLLQAAMHAEAVWPDPAEPNRLPVPWAQYYGELNRYPAKAESATVRVSAEGENLRLQLQLPAKAMAELAGACLDFSAPVIKE